MTLPREGIRKDQQSQATSSSSLPKLREEIERRRAVAIKFAQDLERVNISFAGDLKVEINKLDTKFVSLHEIGGSDEEAEILKKFASIWTQMVRTYSALVCREPKSNKIRLSATFPPAVSQPSFSYQSGSAFSPSVAVSSGYSSQITERCKDSNYGQEALDPFAASQIPDVSSGLSDYFPQSVISLTGSPPLHSHSLISPPLHSQPEPRAESPLHLSRSISAPSAPFLEDPKKLDRFDRWTPFPVKKHSKQKVKRENFPADVIRMLKQWLNEHFEDPYPSAEVKLALAEKTNLTYEQVQHWFVNARMRIWRPEIKKRIGNKTEPPRRVAGYPRHPPRHPPRIPMIEPRKVLQRRVVQHPLETQMPAGSNDVFNPSWLRVPLALGGTKCQTLDT